MSNINTASNDRENTENNNQQHTPAAAADTFDTLSYTPLNIPHNYAMLDRECVQFHLYPGQEWIVQPFAPWCKDKNSIEFLKEYYRYVADPVNNRYSKVEERVDIVEWEDLTPEAINDICARLEIKFEELQVYKFFHKLRDGSYRATHDLISQMSAVSPNPPFPMYLAGGHLGNADNAASQFDYYTKTMMKGYEDLNVIPNRPTLVRIFQELVKWIKASGFNRLYELEIPVQEVSKIFKAAGAEPFGLYESLLRDQLGLVSNITDGDTIGFKLHPTFIRIIFMCCPNDRYIDR